MLPDTPDHVTDLPITVQLLAATPVLSLFARSFGTADLAVILARITNGLRRATLLEARLSQRAERGRDLTVAPIRLPATRASGAAQQVAPPAPLPEPQRADHTEDPRLARLPTEEEISTVGASAAVG
jgi:hypothetical protein